MFDERGDALRPVSPRYAEVFVRAIPHPVTGGTMDVYMRPQPNGGPPLFHAPAAWSPAQPHLLDEYLSTMGDRDPLVCPWTGRALTRVDLGDGSVMHVGGFDPCMPAPADVFFRAALMLPTAPAARVEPVDDAPAPLSREKPVTQEAVDAMLSVTEPPRSKNRRRR